MSLYRKVGAEPLIVINSGTKNWTDAIGSEEVRSNDWMQEACDWLECCNGSSNTRLSAVCVQNGQHEPYNVQYWEINNEFDSTLTSSAEYVEIINTLVPRLKKIDPNIKIVFAVPMSAIE